MIANGGTEADAEAYLTKFFNHVAALPGSGRDATNAFLQGAGNVLISYENEAILARQSGEDFDYIVPDGHAQDREPGCGAEGRQPEGQGLPRLRAERGRAGGVRQEGLPARSPRTPPSARSTAPTTRRSRSRCRAKLFTISDLGGWDAVNAKFFDEETGIVPEIQKATGKSQ